MCLTDAGGRRRSPATSERHQQDSLWLLCQLSGASPSGRPLDHLPAGSQWAGGRLTELDQRHSRALETGPCGKSSWPGRRASEAQGLGCRVPVPFLQAPWCPSSVRLHVFNSWLPGAVLCTWAVVPESRAPALPEAESEQAAGAPCGSQLLAEPCIVLHTEPWVLPGPAVPPGMWPVSSTFRPRGGPRSLVVGPGQEAGCLGR